MLFRSPIVPAQPEFLTARRKLVSGEIQASAVVKLFRTDQFSLPLPASHRFPIAKYARLRERVLEAALVAPHDLLVPDAATDRELSGAHTAEYIGRVTQGRLSAREIRALGFPWSTRLVERSRRSSGATVQACRAALTEGYGVNLGGGTHHALDCTAPWRASLRTSPSTWLEPIRFRMTAWVACH